MCDCRTAVEAIALRKLFGTRKKEGDALRLRVISSYPSPRSALGFANTNSRNLPNSQRQACAVTLVTVVFAPNKEQVTGGYKVKLAVASNAPVALHRLPTSLLVFPNVVEKTKATRVVMLNDGQQSIEVSTRHLPKPLP